MDDELDDPRGWLYTLVMIAGGFQAFLIFASSILLILAAILSFLGITEVTNTEGANIDLRTPLPLGFTLLLPGVGVIISLLMFSERKSWRSGISLIVLSGAMLCVPHLLAEVFGHYAHTNLVWCMLYMTAIALTFTSNNLSVNERRFIAVLLAPSIVMHGAIAYHLLEVAEVLLVIWVVLLLFSYEFIYHTRKLAKELRWIGVAS